MKTKMGRPKSKERTSARLRATEKVARLAGFEYNVKQYTYGGFLDTYQLELIAEKLEKLERLEQK